MAGESSQTINRVLVEISTNLSTHLADMKKLGLIIIKNGMVKLAR